MAYLKKLNSVNSIELTATSATGAGVIKQVRGGSTNRLLHTWDFNGVGHNLFVGQNAGNLDNTLTGTQNTVIGESAGIALTSGGANTLGGRLSGGALTSGGNNTAFGKQSLSSAVTTDYNSAFGSLSLSACIGTQNTAAGTSSLAGLTSGGNNVGIGMHSGNVDVTVTTAANCTFLGGFSSSTTVDGSYRTAVGAYSKCPHDNAIKLGRNASSTGVGAYAGDVTIISSFNDTQRTAHGTPVNGSIIYNSNAGATAAAHEFQVYVNGAWFKLLTAAVTT